MGDDCDWLTGVTDWHACRFRFRCFYDSFEEKSKKKKKIEYFLYIIRLFFCFEKKVVFLFLKRRDHIRQTLCDHFTVHRILEFTKRDSKNDT